MRIAVVGAGIAGLTTAWLLEPSHDVTLYEADKRAGGHADSVTVPTGHGEVQVDLGAQYVSTAGFPVHGRLMDALGVRPADLAEAPVTFTMSASHRKEVPLIVSPHAPDDLRGNRTPVTGPAWNSLSTFLAAAAEFAAVGGDWTVSLAELLGPLALPEDHVRQVIHPLMAYISSCEDAQAPELSARAATAFFLALAPQAPGHAPVWANATCGLGETASRIAGQLRSTEIRTATAVTAVRRLGSGYEITDSGGGARMVERVVLALPAHAAVPLLEPLAGRDDVRRAMAAFPYAPATVAVHRDAAYMPIHQAHWSTVNLDSHDGHTEASNWYGPVLGPPGQQVFKSWITHRDRPEETIAVREFRHLVLTTDAVRARAVLDSRQGEDGLYFAGSHLTYIDSQEGAVRSAVAVAEHLGCDSPRLAALADPAADTAGTP